MRTSVGGVGGVAEGGVVFLWHVGSLPPPPPVSCVCVGGGDVNEILSRAQCKKKKENGQPMGGMGGRHAATTQGF